MVVAQPGWVRGDKFQSWVAIVCSHNRKAAVGEVGVIGEEERTVATDTSNEMVGMVESRCDAAHLCTSLTHPDQAGQVLSTPPSQLLSSHSCPSSPSPRSPTQNLNTCPDIITTNLSPITLTVAFSTFFSSWLGEVGSQLEKKVEKATVKVMGERLVVMMSGQVLRFCVGDRGEGELGQLCELSSWLGGVDRTWPAWSGCVRLVQRWAASHLLSTIPTIALEVSVATVLSSSPITPTSPTAAFLLWLHTMATHDWNLSPLTHPGCATTMPRSSLPPMAVLCPHSPSPSYWTRSVTWPELQRLVNLATTSLSSPPSLSMFKPSLTCYEALIHLKPLQVPTRNLAISSMLETKEITPSTTTDVSTLPILSHNPVTIFVSTLQSCYGNLANFYYDKFGGTVVAVKLITKGEVKDKVKLGDLTCKMVTEGTVSTNWGAVMEDWAILGEGLVREVEVVNTDLLL